MRQEQLAHGTARWGPGGQGVLLVRSPREERQVKYLLVLLVLLLSFFAGTVTHSIAVDRGLITMDTSIE